MEGFLAVLDEDLVMHEAEGFVGGGTFTGKEEFMAALGTMTNLRTTSPRSRSGSSPTGTPSWSK